MGYRYVVLGAGRQGVALAYDLLANGEADDVLLADLDADGARRGLERLEQLLPDAQKRIRVAGCDVGRPAEAAMVMTGADVVLSAVPYRFNAKLTEAALAVGVHFCDLGGNTQVVQEQLAHHREAHDRGISIVPDCGLAPGLGNILAAHGAEQMEKPAHVHVRCGGLPQENVGPLGYKLVFNFDGLINEYSGWGEFLREGMQIVIPALAEVEPITFPPPVGECECAVTSGGTSTCSASFLGRLQSYDYKTVRYPGHFAVIRAMFELGCFDEDVALSDGTTLQPKPVTRRLFEEKLGYPEIRDLVVLRTTVIGEQGGRSATWTYDLLDRHDEKTGFSAMERTTAFPAALVAYMQARGDIAPGAQPLEKCIPTQKYVDELPAHDIRVTLSKS